jgi:hypothetical protein
VFCAIARCGWFSLGLGKRRRTFKHPWYSLHTAPQARSYCSALICALVLPRVSKGPSVTATGTASTADPSPPSPSSLVDRGPGAARGVGLLAGGKADDQLVMSRRLVEEGPACAGTEVDTSSDDDEGDGEAKGRGELGTEDGGAESRAGWR